tara:strand:+ start:34403 stop:36253 length:1851 start_codon:yes stop_codon:yes gene_type:complete
MSENLSKYKKLSSLEHVLQRSGMYLGSTAIQEQNVFVPGKKGRMTEHKLSFSPALLKMFDEIISNSVDEHIRSGSVSKIDVTINQMGGEISISDNGGIPVQKHPEYKQWIPEMIFGEMRTGSNFGDEERTTAGLNGLGSKLTSIFSKEFTVTTSDGKKRFTQTFKNNLSERSEPKIVQSNSKGTTITFTPDYERLGCELDTDTVQRIQKRVYDVAGCNPLIQVTLNKIPIRIASFESYARLFSDELVSDKNKDWEIVVCPSEDEFKQISFVNGVDTYNGGTHVDYIVNQITNKLREYIKKKHKVDVKPSNIKQHLFVFINCRINAPTFTSQTKENMSSDVKDFGTSFEVSDKFIRALTRSEVVQKVLDWAEAQQRQKELAEMRKVNKQAQKKNHLKKIVKFDDATGKKREECSLLLAEGDSAAKTLLSAREPKTIGVYPLKGKPLNVRDIKLKRLTSNEEFANIMSILGLKLGHEADPSQMRFGKVIIAADFDPDGSHICGLIVNMFQQFWPNLLKEGMVYRLRTPLIVATKNKKEYEFFSREEFQKWASKNPNHSYKYYKGLGSWTTKAFKKFLNDENYHEQLTYDSEDDFKSVDLAFDKSKSNARKDWLLGTQY